ARTLHEHPEQARVHAHTGDEHRLRRAGSRVALRHAGREDLSTRNEAHGRRRVGTGETAATRVVIREARVDCHENTKTGNTRTKGLSCFRAFVAGAFLSSVSLAFATGVTAHAQERTKTVADGVYSEAQAERGAAAYDGACGNCHRADLGGASGPAL